MYAVLFNGCPVHFPVIISFCTTRGAGCAVTHTCHSCGLPATAAACIQFFPVHDTHPLVFVNLVTLVGADSRLPVRPCCRESHNASWARIIRDTFGACCHSSRRPSHVNESREVPHSKPPLKIHPPSSQLLATALLVTQLHVVLPSPPSSAPSIHPSLHPSIHPCHLHLRTGYSGHIHETPACSGGLLGWGSFCPTHERG